MRRNASMRIEPVEKDQAPEAVREVYQQMEERGGRVSSFFKMLAHKPDMLRTFDPFYRAIWAPGALSPAVKELAYLRVSILNGCPY